MMVWSQAQTRAIETTGRNVLVAAAAGSGKTAVLVERIIRRVLAGGFDIDRLLVVTFTKAAAAEMRARIEAALAHELAEHPDNAAIERQLILLSNASISTLHSFCQNIIRRNFNMIDLDPGFRLASEQEIDLMQQEVLEDLLEQHYAAGEADFLDLVDKYGSDHGDGALHMMVRTLYGYAMSQPFPAVWLDKQAAVYCLPETAKLSDTIWMPVVQQEIKMTLSACQELHGQSVEAAVQLGADFYMETLQEDGRLLDYLAEAGAKPEWSKWSEAFYGFKFSRIAAAPRGTDEALKKAVIVPRNRMKKLLDDLVGNYFMSSEKELLGDIRAVAPSVRMVCTLAKEFAISFAAAKKEKDIVDFNDLEHFALAVLRDPAAGPGELQPSVAAQALQEKYQEVMVDEYQDINGVQEAILSLVCKKDQPDLFTVGDVKQSIYRFRLADPSLFLKKYRMYPQWSDDYERIDLALNFRSRAAVLSSINFLFAQLMVPETMELGYDEAAALHPGLVYPPAAGKTLSGETELDIITADDGSSSDRMVENDGDTTAFVVEGRFIAERIRELIDSQVQVFAKDAKGYRTISYHDIVVLLRSGAGKADKLLEILRDNDIPAYASIDAGYFEAMEIRIMLDLLSVIDNARQDIPLAAVLHSPIGGFSATELAELRIVDKKVDLFGALLKTGGPDGKASAELHGKAARFLGRLDKWRTMSCRVGVPELIWQLYRDTGYYDYVGGMPGGLLRQANLRMLCDRAAEYEKAESRGLFRFLRFIERMKARQNDLAVNRTLSENEDVVRIMTVHKSKGLEFPVVFVADLGKAFNLSDAGRPPLLVHKELGLGSYRTEPDKSLRYPTLARRAVAAKIVQESKAEELRVLYVALTRAREKLILVGTVRDAVARTTEWCRYIDRIPIQLPAHAPLAAKSFLDWIGMAVVRHPDGEILRKLADTIKPYVHPAYGDDSHWDVHLIAASAIPKQADKTAGKEDLLSCVARREPMPGSGSQAMVEARLDWQYDYHGLREVPAKLSVTEMKRRFAVEDAEALPLSALQPIRRAASGQIFRRPSFIQASGRFTGAEYGTIMHSVMQHIDFHRQVTMPEIAMQLAAMVKKEILLPGQREAVDDKAVYDFFDSAMGRRMRNSPQVWRELPFSRLIEARRFYPQVQDGKAAIFIQGVIDVLFAEGDGLVLLDYKTDNDTDPVRVAARHKLQIDLYSESVQQILHKKVKERCLYMLHDGSIVLL
jgi:ATP-dependent helicase/nuclease subunit A